MQEVHEVQEHDMCRVCSLDIPNKSNMYTVQAKTFIYGGECVPSLTHCYNVPSTKFTHLAHVFLATPPSFDDIATTEKVIIKSARYQGILTSTGLQEYSQLQRPIATCYSPPLVDIVKDHTGNVRAILVDAAYYYTNKAQHSHDSLVNKSKDSVIQHMQRKEYTNADHAYRTFSMECMKQLPERSTACPWRT